MPRSPVLDLECYGTQVGRIIATAQFDVSLVAAAIPMALRLVLEILWLLERCGHRVTNVDQRKVSVAWFLAYDETIVDNLPLLALKHPVSAMRIEICASMLFQISSSARLHVMCDVKVTRAPL